MTQAQQSKNSLDVNLYIEEIKAQRNGAIDQCALLGARLQQQDREIAALRAALVESNKKILESTAPGEM